MVGEPGSVGKAHLGVLHICDKNGTDLAAGEEGMVYFEQATDHLNTMRLRKPRAPHIRQTKTGPHLEMSAISTKTAVILTDEGLHDYFGGVNIYPQEIEDAMVLHPAVQDVAVFGVPNSDFGEEVKAVVQLTHEFTDEEQLTDDRWNSHAKNLRPIRFLDH